MLGMNKTDFKKWEIVVLTFEQNVLDITFYYYHNNEKFLRIVGALEHFKKLASAPIINHVCWRVAF